jgi:membrane protein YdbS with pleckstrin-like domain
LIPIWIVAMIQYGVRLASTRYSVRHGSLRHSYRFLTLHDREFACEKITGMVIKRNLWDRMFGTMTLRFWSIGSGKPLEFTHVHGSEFDLPSLMRQVGIPAASAEPYEVKAEFGFVVWLRAGLIYLPIWMIFVVATVFAAIEFENDPIYYLLGLPLIVGFFAWGRGMLYYPRQRLLFHQHHVEARQGIVVQRQYFARYGNIKRSESTCYPGGKKGKLEIFVAGEEEVLQGVQQQRHGVKGMQPALKQCSFTSGYLPEVVEKALLLDGVLSGRAEPGQQVESATGQEVLLEARRSVGNAMVQLILVSVLLSPLIVLLPVTVPIVWIRVGRWRYRVEDFRVVVSRGVFYRKQTSILLDRVDSLQQKLGVLNKVFRNGDVSIMTAGSSKPDLKIIDSPGYLALYQLIRERSQ